MYISEIRDEMNRICERDNMKKIPATRLVRILMDEGLVKEDEDAGKYGKEPTEKGKQSGIKTIEQIGKKGKAYTMLQYPKEIQKMLIERFVGEEKQEDFD